MFICYSCRTLICNAAVFLEEALVAAVETWRAALLVPRQPSLSLPCFSLDIYHLQWKLRTFLMKRLLFSSKRTKKIVYCSNTSLYQKTWDHS